MRAISCRSLLRKEGRVAQNVAILLPFVFIVCALQLDPPRTLGDQPETRAEEAPAKRERRRRSTAGTSVGLVKRAIESLKSESASIEIQGRGLTEEEQKRVARNNAAVTHLGAALKSLENEDQREPRKEARADNRRQRRVNASSLIKRAIESLESEAANIQIQGRALSEKEKATVVRNAVAVKHLRQAIAALGEDKARSPRRERRRSSAAAIIKQAQRQLQSEAGSIERVGRALTPDETAKVDRIRKALGHLEHALKSLENADVSDKKPTLEPVRSKP